VISSAIRFTYTHTSQHYHPVHSASESFGLFRKVDNLKVQYVAIPRGKEYCTNVSGVMIVVLCV